MQSNDQQNPQAYQNFMFHPQQVQNVFPFRNMQESDQLATFLDSNSIGEKLKNSTSDDDRLNVREEGFDGHSEGGREKKGTPWQRVKWTDNMVKLLITAVSYLGDDALSDSSGGRRRNALHSLKKGKWKAISKVMDERGYHVSPQQCEDKFNDLNKRYKRLNDIIGRGTCCKVVENPALLDLMDLSEKAKGDVRKILNSKQLFYQEMCSYHNGNRLHLPHDWVLQQSLQSVLKSGSYKPGEFDEENDSDGRNDDNEEDHALQLGKRKKRMEEHESTNFLDYKKRLDPCPPNDLGDANRVFSEEGEREQLLKRWMISRSLQLKERKLQIQSQMFELEEQRSKWLRFSQIEDTELDKMRLANECLKLENERLALELKRQSTDADYN